MKFTKKPVTIEAVQFLGLTADREPQFSEAPQWLLDAMALDKREPGSVWIGEGWRPPILHIFTLEGVHQAKVNDWIVRGIKGEVYPVKPDIFAQSYDPAEA